MEIYNKIKSLISKYAYIVYALLFILSLGACFYGWFVYLIAAAIFAIGIFADPTLILSLLLFLYPFESIFIFNMEHRALFITFLKLYLIADLFIRHVIISIKQKASANIKILVVFAVYIVYCILPPHVVGLKELALLGAELALIYIVFQKKLKFDFSFIAESLVVFVLVSSVMGFLRPTSDRLQEFIPIFMAIDKERFSGLMTQPNIYGMVIVVALSLLCTIKYHEKINDTKFVIYNSLLLYFGFMSISRSFFVATCIIELVFTILYAVRYKRESLRHLGVIYAGMLIAVLCSLGSLRLYFKRFFGVFSNKSQASAFFDSFAYDGYIDEDILNGTVRYDPGRLEIWKLYLKDIFINPVVFFFGRGISRTWIGQMATHNDYLQLFWINGFFGTLIYIAGILMFVDLKKITKANIKNNLFLLIFILPTAFILLIEHHPLGKLIFVMIMLLMDYGKECDSAQKLKEGN